MPGILAKSNSSTHSTLEFDASTERMVYAKNITSQPTYQDDHIVATIIPTPLISSQPYLVQNHIHIWVNGEHYGKSKDLAQILLDGYKNDRLIEVLHDTDGYFSALIYDTHKKQLHSITDRYGFKPLYIYHDEPTLVITSELKCMASFSDIKLTVNAKAIGDYLKHGQMIGNTTWFSEVTMQGAATVISFDLVTQQRTSQLYWSWNEITRSNDAFDHAIDRTYDLLQCAVQKRIGDHDTSLALSGGLDSRTILALSDPKSLNFTYTFGKRGSEDVSLAKKLSNLDGIEHIDLTITDDNWYYNRVEGIWKTDGMCNMMHMHASNFHNQLAVRETIHLNGFAGDLVLGGSWIDHTDTNLKAGDDTIYQDLASTYLHPDIQDSYFIDNRVRRFTHAGISEATRLLPHRLPFFDNDLIEYLYSLPTEYRRNNKLYLAIYKKKIDSKYSQIKYQKTGAPLLTMVPLYYRLQQKCKRGLSKVGLIHDGQYAAYPIWFKQQKTKIHQHILHPQALIKNYVDVNLNAIFDSLVDVETLSRMLTIEIWLQQIVNNTFYTTQEVFSS